MNTNRPHDQTATPSNMCTPLIDLLLPGLGWKEVMTGNQKREFNEWWHETIFPELAALGRLIVRL